MKTIHGIAMNNTLNKSMQRQCSRRIQVGFSKPTLDAIDRIATSQGMKCAAVCSSLIEEALINRGELPNAFVKWQMPAEHAVQVEDSTDGDDLAARVAHLESVVFQLSRRGG